MKKLGSLLLVLVMLVTMFSAAACESRLATLQVQIQTRIANLSV